MRFETKTELSRLLQYSCTTFKPQSKPKSCRNFRKRTLWDSSDTQARLTRAEVFDYAGGLEDLPSREESIFPVHGVVVVAVEHPHRGVRLLRHGAEELYEAVLGRAVHGQVLLRLDRHAGISRHHRTVGGGDLASSSFDVVNAGNHVTYCTGS